MQMKILHYIPSIDRSSGGVGVYMQLLAKPLGRLAELHVVTHREDNPLHLENATVHYVSSSLLGKFQSEWADILDSLKPDVVHANTCWLPMSSIAQKIAQKRGYKVVLSPHGMLEPWIVNRHYWTKKVPAMLLYQRTAVKNADILHATAESEKQNIVELGLNDRVAVIPNGVDVDAIAVKTSWARTRTIVFLSRIHVKKGINFLLEAVAQMRDRLQGYKVVVAGEGDAEYIKELKQLAMKLGVQYMVDFAGGVYEDVKWRLLRDADVFVLPTHSENFGIVVAEALACGTPVITTTGTPWSELRSCNCGWQVAVGRESLVNALSEFLIKTDDELREMGLRGRKLIEEKYSTESIALQMIEMYKSL